MSAPGRRARALLALGIALALPPRAAAQVDRHDQPTWVADVGVAGANIAAGALTAALTAAIRGHDISEAFLEGAVGGGLVFLGKRVTVERFDAAGLLGREIAAVGSNVVVNGGEGRGWLGEVWLPLGPAWLQVRRGAGVRARVDLNDVGTIIWAATRSELHFDLGRSLSNGATVFVARHHRIDVASEEAAGFAAGGVVALGVTPLDVDVVQSHENVHVIQHDYLLQTVTRPLERWGWRWITERDVPLDVNVLLSFVHPLHDLHESEAKVLEVR